MATREQLARVITDLPSGVVRWASAPTEEIPRLSSGIPALDGLLGGGWPRGRVCSVRTDALFSTGRTSLAAHTVTAASRQGLLTAWIDGNASLDPASLRAGGADLERILWVRGPLSFGQSLTAAEEVLRAGGFEILVVRTAARRRSFKPGRTRGESRTAAWIRLSRAVERGRSVLLALSDGAPDTIPGSVPLKVDASRSHWAGTTGLSSLLLGTGVRVEVEGAGADLEMVAAEML